MTSNVSTVIIAFTRLILAFTKRVHTFTKPIIIFTKQIITRTKQIITCTKQISTFTKQTIAFTKQIITFTKTIIVFSKLNRKLTVENPALSWQCLSALTLDNVKRVTLTMSRGWHCVWGGFGQSIQLTLDNVYLHFRLHSTGIQRLIKVELQSRHYRRFYFIKLNSDVTF